MLRKSYDFDPVQNRESFLTLDQYLIRFMNDTHFNGLKPMGEIARHRLQDTVRCWLAGLDELVAPALPRYCDWLTQALERSECVGERPDLHHAALHSARAMGRWMLGGDPALDDWQQAAEGEHAVWFAQDAPADPTQIAERRLEDFLAYCLQSRQFQIGIEEADRRVSRRRLGLRPRPREFAYALCRHHAHGEHDEAALFQTGRRMLQLHVADWLSRGRMLECAMWLKIVYWDRDALRDRLPRETPRRVVLRAYDNMARVAVPAFVQLERA